MHASDRDTQLEGLERIVKIHVSLSRTQVAEDPRNCAGDSIRIAMYIYICEQ
jgi:hypothetical protein